MKRVLAVAALAVAATPLLAAAPASAAGTTPSACLHVTVNVNGTGQSQDICLPPSGSLF
jgi:hypothetical protein